MAAGALPDARRLERLLKLGAALLLLAIPLKIVALGWLPQDDVRRHTAKVVSGKAWTEILVLRPEATVDLHPGWHATLDLVRGAGAETPRALALFSIVALAGAFLLAGLVSVRAFGWLSALLAVALLEPIFFPRLFSGRPFVLAMTALVLVAVGWERLTAARAPRGLLAGYTALFAAVSWVHGNWYLWLLPLACFFLAGERLAGLRIAGCWMAGTLLGALLTGHPIAYLAQWIAVPRWSIGGQASLLAIASEFQPGQGGAPLLLGAGLLLLARRSRLARPLARDPVFLLALIGWLLGLWVSRFWSDWGIPALLVWGARELGRSSAPPGALDPSSEDLVPAYRLAAVAATLFAGAAFFLSVTGNRGERWSSAEAGRHLAYEDPATRPWLPDPGGVLYANSMGLFYDTFFENPKAPFRYVLGFEPGLMPPRDLAILRGMVAAGAADDSLLPWAGTLRPEDRLAVVRPGVAPPRLPGLDWYSPFSGLWLGRLRPVGEGPRQQTLSEAP